MSTQRSVVVIAAILLTAWLPAGAQPPGEVAAVRMNDPTTLVWDATVGADAYNVYRGLVSWLAWAEPPRCHGEGIPATGFQTVEAPSPGEGFFYLVTAESAEGEGTPGTGSDALERDLLGSCDSVVRHHVLTRTGWGGDEWSRDRLDLLGVAAYIDEQLDPASIDESTNQTLNDRLAPIEPPDNHLELFATMIVKDTYARRQFEQQVAMFFTNHLNTDFNNIYGFYLGQFPQCGEPPLPFCDEDYPNRALRHAALDMYNETEWWRDMAFNSTFRELIERSAKSPAMIYYLDTFNNLASAPNENYARELVELHTMDVDRYTQQDVEELARVFTGWNVCAKLDAQAGDPLAPCETLWWRPGRTYAANFRVNQHDCGEKILFLGEPYETVIPDTCDGLGAPTPAGIDDLEIALDAIVAHPATPQFITRKLIQRFVTETPTQEMIDEVVAAWNDPGNPRGVGDLREVLRAVLSLDAFSDPDRIRDKVKTPVEHAVSALRATRGSTDGLTILVDYLVRMQQIPYFNPVPTGYSEIGADWIDTNNMLERQNYGLHLTLNPDPGTQPNFSADVLGLLQDHGVSTAPGNAEEIVDFFIDVLFGGALGAYERQEAIEYLNTDDFGAPSDYDDERIRETVGFMLGFAQFQEQ
jgi:hypothetical protein